MTRMLVITDPHVQVDRNSIAAWCSSGPFGGLNLEPLAENIDVVCPDTTEGLLAAVAERPVDEPVVVVTSSHESENLRAHLPLAEDRRIVWVELERATTRRLDARPLIRGRGAHGYHWALRTAHWRWQVPFHTYSYGPEPENIGDLRLPKGEGPFPTVVVLHGGAYQEQWERDTVEPMAIDLTRRGLATWNIEYRRVGLEGVGGWPTTFEDVAAAVDHLAVLAQTHPIDLDRVVFLGHSAGGHLALWAAARPGLPEDAPGGGPRVVPRLAVSLAGVVDLVFAHTRGSFSGAQLVGPLMGATPAQDPSRYELASPSHLSIAVPQLLVQGIGFDDLDLIDMNRRYAARHPDVSYVEIEGSDHFDITYPYSSAWRAVVNEIEKKLSRCA